MKTGWRRAGGLEPKFFILMLDRISSLGSATAVLSGSSVVLVGAGAQKRIALESVPVLLGGKYVVGEDKRVLEIAGDGAKEVARVVKTPTKLCRGPEEGSALYIADRAGSVYELAADGQSAPRLLFGSISMVSDMCVLEDRIVTADKDSKIRITRRHPPHAIEQFVLVHAKPLASLAVVQKRYIVAGGHDEYLSVYDMEAQLAVLYSLAAQETLPFDLARIPGVEDPARIRNAARGACRAKKIVASGDRVLVLLGSAPLLLRLLLEGGRPSLSAEQAPGLGALEVHDAKVREGGFAFITNSGQIYALDRLSLTQVGQIEGYSPEEDFSALEKRQQRE